MKKNPLKSIAKIENYAYNSRWLDEDLFFWYDSDDLFSLNSQFYEIFVTVRFSIYNFFLSSCDIRYSPLCFVLYFSCVFSFLFLYG